MKQRVTFANESMREATREEIKRAKLTQQRYTPKMVVVETKQANKRISTRIILTGRPERGDRRGKK